jgi:hypothetical protein
VYTHDLDLDGDQVTADDLGILSDAMGSSESCLQLDGAFQHARGSDHFRWSRREAGALELLCFVAIAALLLGFGHGIAGGRQREAINIRRHGGGRQVQDTLPGSQDVLRGGGARAEAEHASPAKPPGGGHWRKIRTAIGIERADEHHGRAEVEDGWVGCGQHAASLERAENESTPELAVEIDTIRRIQRYGIG